MIKSLTIKNYAIIEDLEIHFSEGLTIITGETGAGKSILLGALGLIMGERADLKVFYDLQKKCIVEGVFEIAKYKLQPFFESESLDYADELVMRREITPSGKTRAFVNDSPVTLDVLKKLSGALIDLHQQFDTLDIHEVSFQLRLLDALAGNGPLLESFSQLFQDYQANTAKLSQLKFHRLQAEKESDFLNFQLEELASLNLEPDEQESLEEELQQLSHAEEIKQTLSAAFHALSESEQAVIGQLQEIIRSLQAFKKFSGQLGEQIKALESQTMEIQEIANGFAGISENTEYNPERIQLVQSRLDMIYRLQKKHQVMHIRDLLAIQEKLEIQLSGFSDLGDSIASLEKAIGTQKKELDAIAARLSEARKKVVPAFQMDIHQKLALLSMGSARLEITIDPMHTLSQTGADDVRFLFAANKGSRLQEIKDVASGGELSRLTLVTKSLVASAIPLPSLIFDEIDSGVSGDVALKMGQILRDLSNKHQVVVITHSPQVAAMADKHYQIFKEETDEKTFTRVKSLGKPERIHTLAVMLSQNPPSDAALKNAGELLNTAALLPKN